MYRSNPLFDGGVYHLMNKSIAGYKIFTCPRDYCRFIQLLRYFSLQETPTKFSDFCERDQIQHIGFERSVKQISAQVGECVQIIAYCLMPTHFHLIAKQISANGISNLLRKTLDSYSHYFNIKYKRLGPLWVGPYKNVTIETDEQLLHVTRYLHINPTTAGLVKKPEDWTYSSYREYITPDEVEHPLTNREGIIDMKPREYQTFVNDQKTYQRELALIKKQILE